MDARRVELILSRVEALPSLSPAAARLLDLMSSDEGEVAEVVRLIESDPAMAGRVLSLCRRADTGLGGRITTVQHAVVMLGLDAVRSAVLGVSVLDLARSREFDGAGEGGGGRFDRAGFWRHSIATACGTEMLARASPELDIRPGEGFVAGLLADLGKLALAVALPRAYSSILATARERSCAASVVERAVLGLDSHTAGKRLGEHWCLPLALQDVMWMHAQRMTSIPNLPHKALIGAVRVARGLARQLHLGWSGDFGPAEDVADLCVDVGVARVCADRLIPALVEEVADRCRLLGVDAPDAPEMLLQAIGAANSKLASAGAALEHRARRARSLERSIEAITCFLARANRTTGLVGVLEEVQRSARALDAREAGERPGLVLVVQAREGERCVVAEAGPSGEIVRLDESETPGRSLWGALRPAWESSDDSTPGLAASDDVRVIAVGSTRAGEGHWSVVPLWRHVSSEGGVAAMVREARDAGSSGVDASLIACWGSAIAAALRHDGARRLSEQLAESNRALAEAQGQLAESRAMARLGELTAGAAHEMNNPLAVISGRAQILAARATSPEAAAGLEAISSAAGRLSDLITSLNLIAKPPVPTLAHGTWGEIASRAGERARAWVGGGERVRMGSGSELRVEADRELLAAALAELIRNALEASPDGIVEVEAHRGAEDGRLVFVVRDQGPGFSTRSLEHGFDAFFSEKPAGRQTGLGLTRARRIVELHGGGLALENAAAGGAVVRGWLPGAEPARKAA